jgi:hypothetical protein
MLRKTDEWIMRIKAVEREHGVARLAIQRLVLDADRDASIIQDLGSRDLRNAADGLEGTYLIRLFAEFETGLRSYWIRVKKRKSALRAEVLVNRIGALHDIPTNLVSAVHDVRESRNALIHEREAEVMALSLPTARAHLCKFFARLPPIWP